MAVPDLDKTAKDVKTESDAVADASSNFKKAIESFKKAQNVATQAKKELSGDEEE